MKSRGCLEAVVPGHRDGLALWDLKESRRLLGSKLSSRSQFPF
jgi:hypothetical protein